MSKEMQLVVYSRFNDKGTVTSVKSEVIEIDADRLELEEKLPSWKWKCHDELPPMVKYYDGELLELDFNGKIFKVRVGDGNVELLVADCSDNLYIHESRVIALRMEKLAIPKSLPSWSEMYKKSSFNALVFNALPHLNEITDAKKWFLRTCSVMGNMFLLQPVVVNAIKESAESGNPCSLFAYGRYHLCTQPDVNSTDIAIKCFIKACSKGLAEAAVALSMAWDYGETGMVDREKSKVLLTEALNKGCEYAGEYQIRKMVYGLCGARKDPEKAIGICEKLIAEQMLESGKSEVNPLWFYYLGTAKQMLYGWSHGADELQTAACAGVIMAYGDLAIAVSYDDNENLVDKSAYKAAIIQGTVKRDHFCSYLLAIAKVEDFNNMSVFNQTIASKQLIIDLEKAYKLGSNSAAEEIGDIYFYGKYGIEEDNEKAFEYYAKGALYNSPSCCEKMFDMIHDHYIDKQQEFTDMIALKGARLGSEKLLNETVMAYTYGRLTEFASEIEQIYIPVFDKENDDDYNDDTVDDDGRFDAYV